MLDDKLSILILPFSFRDYNIVCALGQQHLFLLFAVHYVQKGNILFFT